MRRALVYIFFVALFEACAKRAPEPVIAPEEEAPETNTCREVNVSFYANSLAGNKTADGGRYDPNAFTAANKTLPFGTRLRLEFEGRTVHVRVNDRGPYVAGRTLDLSHAAAEALGIVKLGHARVRMCREE